MAQLHPATSTAVDSRLLSCQLNILVTQRFLELILQDKEVIENGIICSIVGYNSKQLNRKKEAS